MGYGIWDCGIVGLWNMGNVGMWFNYLLHQKKKNEIMK